jgi:hypothetical protein
MAPPVVDKSSLLGRFVSLSEALTKESDRGVLVLAGAACDKALRDLLKHRGHGASGSFADRIERAKKRGLLTPDTAAQLDLLRDIRNDASHEDENFTLANWEPQLRQIVGGIYPTLTDPFEAREELHRVGLLAATALRVAAEIPTTVPVTPVNLHGIVGMFSVSREMGIAMLVIGFAILVFYLVWKHPEMVTKVETVPDEPDPSPTA